AFSTANGWQYETIQDLGSSHHQQKGLEKLLKRIMQGDVNRLVLTHRDRLSRFGAELVFAVCEKFEAEVVIINKTSEAMPLEQESVEAIAELITMFSVRLSNSRSNA
ncbi:MAG: recombinase family protein, partial [Symploca sp. SIO2D2]|nr:recombinase family protein [Symploca sp. SIO2D2]